MQKKVSVFTWLLPALLGFILLFAVAAKWDLAIDIALYSPSNFLAIFMEGFGWYPVFLPTLYLCMLWMFRPKNTPKPFVPVVAGIVMLAGFVLIFHSSYGTLLKRGLVTGIGDVRTWLWFIAGIALVCFMLVATHKVKPENWAKMEFYAIWGTVFMLGNQVVINLIKQIWQRTRFDDMLASGSLDAFTPFWQPFANGGTSFPSGHTANAASILLLIVLCDAFMVEGKHRIAAYCLSWGFIASMAVSRIVIGRHFLSDTLAAAGIMALLFFAMRRTKYYKNGLEKVLAASTPIPPEEE